MSKEHPCTGPKPAIESDGGLLRCTSCGAFQRLNPETGNITWIRAGRVISAPLDQLEAQLRHDQNYPKSAESAEPTKGNAHGNI